MEPDNLTLRQYGVGIGDWQTVSGWHEARHGCILPETDLPPLGVICEDEHGPVAAIFAYQANGIGVAIADSFLTRPGIGLKHAKKVGERALSGLRALLRLDNYGILKAFTNCRALERVLYQLGFQGTRGALTLKI